jgi:SPX domain protein involved in polyphosphate accumulation
MKFEHQLTFNAHAPWKDAYLNYSKLKALAYDAERHASAAAAARAEGDEREAAARMGAAAAADAAFRRAVDAERHKCLDFFRDKVG